jgi:hypothetical protein
LVFGTNALEQLLNLSKGSWADVSWLTSDSECQDKRALTLGAIKLIGGRSIESSEASKNVDVLLGADLAAPLVAELDRLDPSVPALLMVTGSQALVQQDSVRSWSSKTFPTNKLGVQQLGGEQFELWSWEASLFASGSAAKH